MDEIHSEILLNGMTQQLGLCLIHTLSGDPSVDELPVSLDFIASTRINLSTEQCEYSEHSVLFHSCACPCREFSVRLKNTSTVPKNITIKAYGIIETTDKYVLLTREIDNLSLFPKVWRFPGTRTSECASIEDSIVSSLMKTNIHLPSPELLCLYEKVLPHTLEFGLPRYQELSLFYHFRISNSIDSIEVKSGLWTAINLKRITEFRQLRGSFGSRQISGAHPNEVGEGIDEGHFKALHLLSNLA